MIVRLGYACICESLQDLTTSKNMTYTNYLREHDIYKLKEIIRSNLESLDKIIDYNIKNNIHFYRMSSKIVPLATKSDVDIDYFNDYKDIYRKISKKIYDNNLRVDFHPDQFCVLNSVKKEVIDNSIEILKYHYNLLKYLNVEDKVLVLHIGSSVFGKDNSKKRFINSYKRLESKLKDVIVIENDDKVFNICDCIDIYNSIKIPIVLDYHHHLCNYDDKDISKYLPIIFKSWGKKTPKIHFSSPKNKTKKDFRSHNNYINSDDFIKFLNILKQFDKDVDIMIEAKMKDEAMFRLIRELKYKCNYKFIDETSFII